MKIRINVIDNPIYSQLLFAINTKEVYASELVKELKKSQGTIQKQLQYLDKQNYVLTREHPEKKKNIKLFSVNWEKINEDFAKHIQENANKKRHQLKAYLGKKYEDYIKNQETAMKEREEGRASLFKLKIKELEDRQFNEEETYKDYDNLVKSKRLNKNKYLTKLFQILFSDCNDVYVKYNVPITIKEIFEEAKQSFGFENFTNQTWMQMLDVVLYEDRFPNKDNLDWMFDKEKEKKRREKEIDLRNRYQKLRDDKDFKDIMTLELLLRFVFWGFLIPNASMKLTYEIIKNNKLITKEEMEEYQQFKKEKHKNGINAPKPTEKGNEKARDTHQNKPSTTEKGDNKDEK